MRLTETPEKCANLGLMKLLADYGEGRTSWRINDPLGDIERAECRRLHAALVDVVDRLFAPMLDRVNAREMKTFTMHDSKHGLKVAHLMWSILVDERRSKLTPPEIAMLVISAHLHDLGMGMSDDERAARLEANSDLWLKLDAAGTYKRTLGALKAQIAGGALADTTLALALNQVAEAQDALLCVDIRERHATPTRYGELIESFRRMHREGEPPTPSIDAAMMFGGDSFEARLIDICVSHNEDAGCLIESRSDNHRELRFSPEYPIGSCQADLRMVAATLRLADILDFDRERVPSVLYHYLMPRSANPTENISVREWQKHMAIANWDFSTTRLIFRGRSTNPVAHHAVIEFCRVIEGEIKRTKAALKPEQWPFSIGDQVDAEMHSEGFTYLPYRFHLQEERIFELLMGRGIYDTPLAAVRELLQNSVDSCQLRDALLRAHKPSVIPATADRIILSYQDGRAGGSLAKLTISDTGTGMDRWIIENYFLKVGESYYQSPDFLRTNAVLWEKHAGFAPVSEFGIGFVSSFMLSDHIEVETAMLDSPRRDATRRLLDIDGLGRLIKVTEFENSGYAAKEGTKVTLHVKEGGETSFAPQWDEVRTYVREVCVSLPYSITLRHLDFDGDTVSTEQIEPRRLSVDLPDGLEKAAFRVLVGSRDELVQGEIALFPFATMLAHQKGEIESRKFVINQDPDRIRSQYSSDVLSSVMTRGGFSLGEMPGLPTYVGFVTASTGIIRLNAKQEPTARLVRTNLARTRLRENEAAIGHVVLRAWLEPLIADPVRTEALGLGVLSIRNRTLGIYQAQWLEQFSALDLYRAARIIWKETFKDKGADLIQVWETGSGRALKLGIFNDYLHRILLELVLPSVSDLQVGSEATLYVAPPINGWKEELEANRTFVSAPRRWESFATYLPPLDYLLYFDYPGCDWMSNQYRDALSPFSSNELSLMRRCFGKLISARVYSYLPKLSGSEAALFQKVAQLLPEAMIGSTSLPGSPLGSFL